LVGSGDWEKVGSIGAVVEDGLSVACWADVSVGAGLGWAEGSRVDVVPDVAVASTLGLGDSTMPPKAQPPSTWAISKDVSQRPFQFSIDL